jgi:Protein of unknown function (DUF2934)
MTQIRELEDINEEQLVHEQIEKRAYEIYLQHNGEEGHALEDWLIAEQELRQEHPKRESIPLKRKTAIGG